MQQQAGDPQAHASTYQALYQTVALTLHNYDAVRHLDQWLPGAQGLLVPARVRPPLTKSPGQASLLDA